MTIKGFQRLFGAFLGGDGFNDQMVFVIILAFPDTITKSVIYCIEKSGCDERPLPADFCSSCSRIHMTETAENPPNCLSHPKSHSL